MKGDEGITRSEEINGKDSSCQVSNLSTRFGGGFSWHLLPSFQAYFQCNSQPQRTDLTSSGQASAVYTRHSLGPCRYKHEQARVPQLFIFYYYAFYYFLLYLIILHMLFCLLYKGKVLPVLQVLAQMSPPQKDLLFPYMIIISIHDHYVMLLLHGICHAL